MANNRLIWRKNVNRVRKQVKCNDIIQRSIITDEVTVAILDTGERVIILSS